MDFLTCNAEAATARIYAAVKDVFGLVTPRDPTRTGGWFAFWRTDLSTDEAMPFLGFAVGTCKADSLKKYVGYANEKPERLSQNPSHVSSHQSRNEAAGQYGGAIRCGEADNLYFSFSGLYPHEDEFICAVAAYRLDLINKTRLNAIIEASDNPLLKACRDTLVG